MKFYKKNSCYAYQNMIHSINIELNPLPARKSNMFYKSSKDEDPIKESDLRLNYALNSEKN